MTEPVKIVAIEEAIRAADIRAAVVSLRARRGMVSYDDSRLAWAECDRLRALAASGIKEVEQP